MASSQASGNAILRTTFVIGFSLLLLSASALEIRRFWQPMGVFGYGTNLDGVVTGVEPGFPAARAGIQPGDRLDERTMSPQDLEDLLQFPAVPSAGMTRSFGVYHGGERRAVSLVSVPERMGIADEALIVITLFVTVVFITIGSVVVLLRPSPITWGFYFFCIAFAPSGAAVIGMTEIYAFLRSPYAQYYGILHDGLIHYAGVIGLLVFSLRFLQEPIRGWRLWAQRALPFAFVILVGLTTLYVVNMYFLGLPAESVGRAGIALGTFAAFVAVFALSDTYVRRHGADRQRIRWVVLGFAIALIANLVGQLVSIDATNVPFGVTYALSLLNVMAPVAVAYAIVKHRVIDINFVVSRTLVYGILTTLFVGTFAFVDWFVGHVLEQTRWALVAEIGVAIAIGFWLNGLHTRVDRFVESVLFRRRHEADIRLARVAAGLAHATSPALVDNALVEEPLDALELTMAALFRRDLSGGYERVAAAQWPDSMIPSIEASDLLIAHLQGERRALRLAEIHWSANHALAAASRPVLAVPIMLRRELEAIALYGPHRGGEDFDPDEIGSLNALASAAGAAHDHLEAQRLREELMNVKRENESWHLELQRHGWLPPVT